jgi:hypothetical protein
MKNNETETAQNNSHTGQRFPKWSSHKYPQDSNEEQFSSEEKQFSVLFLFVRKCETEMVILERKTGVSGSVDM